MSPPAVSTSNGVPRRARRFLFGALLGGGVVGSYAALALADVVPGGWRLRTLFVPQAVTDARARAAHRAERLAAFRAETDAEARADVLFLGSSTIELFELDTAFPGASTTNRGIGNEPLERLSARLDDTLARTQPRWVVLYAGSVDVRSRVGGTWRRVPEIADGVASVVDRILASDPERRIALIEVLPEREPRLDVLERVVALNARLQSFVATRPRVVWVPTQRPPIVPARSGTLSVPHSRDALRLAPLGYQSLRTWLLEADSGLAAALTAKVPGLGPDAGKALPMDDSR